jgi:hypothetical protein
MTQGSSERLQKAKVRYMQFKIKFRMMVDLAE